VRGIAMPPHPDQAKWFTEEILPHERVLRAHLRGAFPAVRDVDDVVQESFLRVWRARAAQPVRQARAFLFRVARNLALDLVRREARSPLVPVADPAALGVADERADAIAGLDDARRIELLTEAVGALPPRCREIFLLCQVEGRPQREVARQLSLSENTVAVQSARGLQRCEAFVRRRLRQP
jgi:RNA polymerase sigma-70 factor (ECF subfamily)